MNIHGFHANVAALQLGVYLVPASIFINNGSKQKGAMEGFLSLGNIVAAAEVDNWG